MFMLLCISSLELDRISPILPYPTYKVTPGSHSQTLPHQHISRSLLPTRVWGPVFPGCSQSVIMAAWWLVLRVCLWLGVTVTVQWAGVETWSTKVSGLGSTTGSRWKTSVCSAACNSKLSQPLCPMTFVLLLPALLKLGGLGVRWWSAGMVGSRPTRVALYEWYLANSLFITWLHEWTALSAEPYFRFLISNPRE